ncbi:hypothetical protein CHARACLAT_008744 [Characodon lateralis]|uniref:Uncharacterized protein n=1 Tax=Characodon lateralis TaxID=208331 RepID=A0ABU7DRR3_9TELE|nr:hypothetical protein [Characodon lateralis]
MGKGFVLGFFFCLSTQRPPVQPEKWEHTAHRKDRNVSFTPPLMSTSSLPAPPLGAEERDHSVTAWE